jgi:hypothetical protein
MKHIHSNNNYDSDDYEPLDIYDYELSFSWRKWVLMPLLFIVTITCFYFALPTIKTVATSTPVTRTVKEYVTKNIEDIQEGDEVFAYDVQTVKTTKRKVSQVFERSSNHLRYLTVRNQNETQIFETTDSHPFWVVTNTPDLNRAARDAVTEGSITLQHENLAVTKNGFYVEAKDLKVGDTFIGANGEPSTLEATDRKEYPNGISVYNFTVEDNHNYFVIANYEAFQNGSMPVLVHNAKYNADGYQHALHPDHIRAAVKEKSGEITGYNPKTGKPWDHLKETRAAIKGVSDAIDDIKDKLKYLNLKPEQRSLLEKELSRLSILRDRARHMLGE